MLKSGRGAFKWEKCDGHEKKRNLERSVVLMQRMEGK